MDCDRNFSVNACKSSQVPSFLDNIRGSWKKQWKSC